MNYTKYPIITTRSIASLAIFLLLLGVNVSCQPSRINEKEVIKAEIIKPQPKFSLGNTKDTLQFTSGIRSILQDSRGDYWIGSHQEGVCRYDGKTFEYFTKEDGLSDNQVRRIQEDGNGVIWFGTAEWVSNYDGQKINNFALDAFNLNFENPWALAPGDLWFNGGRKVDVNRVNQGTVAYLDIPKEYPDRSENIVGVTGFSKGRNGRLWIAHYGGVIGYDGQNFSYLNDRQLGFLSPGQFLHVRSVFEDSKARLWIGNNGIGVLLKEDGKTINFSRKMGLIGKDSKGNGSLSPPGTLEHVFAIYEDSQGHIWFGDRDTGAWKYDGKEMTNYTVDPQLRRQMIWQIYEDQSGDLLFAMNDRGVYKFTGVGFERVL